MRSGARRGQLPEAMPTSAVSAEQQVSTGEHHGRCLENEEEIGDMRPQKRARTAIVKCRSESSLSSDTLCLGGIPGGHESRGRGADEDPSGIERLCESVADAFRVGTGCRMEARPHQIDCIQTLLRSIHSSGSCQQEPVNYLLQHSTGSGKSLTIAALAYFLLKVHDENGPLFTSVIIVNDRIQLDKQLGDTVSGLLEGNGIGHLIHRASSCDDLSQALVNGALNSGHSQQVVLTTLQKFRLQKLQKRTRAVRRGRVAVIADEAHRSHGSSTTELVHEVLSGGGEQPSWLTYLGFTATPSPMALQLFGVQEIQQAARGVSDSAGESGENAEEYLFTPFHTYSMADAIEDGHVLDVLQDYTTIALHVQVLPAAGGDDETSNTKEGKSTAVVQRVMQAAANHVDVVRSKSEYIADHFLEQLKNGVPGDVRAMVVARSRQHVVWYVLELRRILSDKKHGRVIESLGLSDIGVYGAFSGTVPLADSKQLSVDPQELSQAEDSKQTYESPEAEEDEQGCEISDSFRRGDDAASAHQAAMVTENELNGNHVAGCCSFSSARILVVCNKYETGYDDPRLWFMYVDKLLRGSRAVQTLGRLARVGVSKTAPRDDAQDSGPRAADDDGNAEGADASVPLGKAVKVVDFVNMAGSIQESFEEYAGMTQYSTGERAKTLKRERAMDHCVSRLLHTLLPLLAKHCPEGLQGATPLQVAEATRMLPHDMQLSVMEDVGRYCAACESSKRQKAEIPYAWANKLNSTLKQGCSTSGQSAGPSTLPATGAQPDDLDGFQVEVRTLQETFTGKINLQRKSAPLQSTPYGKASGSARDSTAAASGKGAVPAPMKELAKLPLLEAIKAANEALSGDFQRHAQSALLQIKERLQAALGTAASAADDRADAAAMLRRLQLHLVDSASLVRTGFAPLIKSLKGHPDKEIAELARSLIKSWKSQLKSESNSGTTAGNEAENSSKSTPQSPTVNLPPGIDTTGDPVRDKGCVILLQAITHGVSGESRQALLEKAVSVASAVEEAAFQLSPSKETGPSYRAKLRELASNLRRQESGVSNSLVEGSISAEALVRMDKKGLAPAHVRRVVEAVAKRHRLESERLMKAMGDGASGGTFVNTDVKCQECGAARVAVHTCLTGGTYAEERTIMQKFECRECLHTWRG